jgi:acetyl-CoA C-acetyltransferase/acetyl-CoA acyltransferase
MNDAARGEPLAILGAVRTPFLRAGSRLRRATAGDLARACVVELLARAEVDPGAIDEVILGCAGQPPDAQNVGRVVALRAGLPVSTPAVTVHRNCASGMEALSQADLRLKAGHGRLFLVGGVEVMSRGLVLFRDSAVDWLSRLSRARTVSAKARTALAFRPGMLKPRIGLIEALTDPFSGLIMGKTAEVLAREFGISRERQDRYALESHRRAEQARREGILAEEIAPVMALPHVRELVDQDDGIREGLSEEKLAALKPYFDPRHGSVTVGNSCQLTDGGAAFLVGSAARGRELGLEPLGFVRRWAYAGLDPERMGLGPVYATSRLLERGGGSLEDYERIELNEAFAVQVLACLEAAGSREFCERELGRDRPLGSFDEGRLNVHGGAIALGHPVGATGLRLVLTLLKELRRQGMRRGLATLCVGGGQGAAFEVEAA